MTKNLSLKNGLVLFVWCLSLFFAGLCIVELCYGEERAGHRVIVKNDLLWEVYDDPSPPKVMEFDVGHEDGPVEVYSDTEVERVIIYDKNRIRPREYQIMRDHGSRTITIEEAR